MSATGASVNEDVVDQFYNLKLKHLYRFIQLKMTEGQEIEVEKKVESSTMTDFIEQLPKDDCRYVIYNLSDDGDREKLAFVNWYPVESKHKTKMMYMSSLVALKEKLVGINHIMEATESEELADELKKKIPK